MSVDDTEIYESDGLGTHSCGSGRSAYVCCHCLCTLLYVVDVNETSFFLAPFVSFFPFISQRRLFGVTVRDIEFDDTLANCSCTAHARLFVQVLPVRNSSVFH